MRQCETITRILVACMLAVISRNHALGQATQPAGAIHVGLTADKTEVGRIIMVSLVADGNVIQQGEVSIYASVTDGMAARGFTNVPVGTYDVRLEGEGFVTEIKRGIRVFPDQATQALFTPRRGAGIHIVEYATGSLPREEIAQRLAKIEASLAEVLRALQKK
jgi:hypothetical protein